MLREVLSFIHWQHVRSIKSESHRIQSHVRRKRTRSHGIQIDSASSIIWYSLDQIEVALTACFRRIGTRPSHVGINACRTTQKLQDDTTLMTFTTLAYNQKQYRAIRYSSTASQRYLLTANHRVATKRPWQTYVSPSVNNGAQFDARPYLGRTVRWCHYWQTNSSRPEGRSTGQWWALFSSGLMSTASRRTGAALPLAITNEHQMCPSVRPKRK